METSGRERGIHVPSQSDGRDSTGVLLIEDIQFMSDQIMYDTLSEGEINNNMD